MKKAILLVLITLVASMSMELMAGTPVSSSELPKAAVAFINKHFSADKIRKVEKDSGRRGLEYEVDMVSGAEIEFTEDGNWKDVKAARGNAVPAAVVPSAIAAYVASNFKGQTIVEISRKRGGYEVELANGTELKLTEDAKPMPARPDHRRPR